MSRLDYMGRSRGSEQLIILFPQKKNYPLSVGRRAEFVHWWYYIEGQQSHFGKGRQRENAKETIVLTEDKSR